MKDQFSKIFKGFSDFWKAQEKKRKILYISVLGGIVLLAVVLTIILNHKDYVVLYDGLESSEATEIVGLIEEMDIPVSYTSGGQITVPKENADSIAMDLAVKGYPKSDLNYNVFNQNVDMFTTDYEKREQARMQLQERLIATLKQLDGVEDAVVTLNIPEQKNTVISVNSQPSSASVKLTLRNNGALSDAQINGITKIIMTAVPGLTEENIAITDNTGKLLVEGAGSDGGDITVERNKLRFKQEYQDAIKSEVMNLLADAYGEDNVKISVNANLNYDKQVSEDTKYTPSHDDGSGMIQHEDNKNSSGTAGTSGGVVGVETNAEDTYPTGTESEAGVWSNSESSTSYLINTLKQQTEKQGYYVEDLTVSVIIYTDYLSDDIKSGLVTAVARATSVNEQFVSVMNLQKTGDKSDVFDTSSYPFGWSRQVYLIVMALDVAMIILFTFVYVSVSGKAKKKRRFIEKQTYLVAQAAGESGEVQGHFNNKKHPEGEDYELESLMNGEAKETKQAAVRREIADFAHSSPEIVAQLLKSWLREEEARNGGSSSGSSSGSGSRRK